MRKLLIALGLIFYGGSALAQSPQCGRVANGSSGAATTLVLTAVAGQAFHLCGWDITSTAAATFQLIYGTGATCGTGTFNITAAHAMTNQSVVSTMGSPGRFSLPQNTSLCIIVGGTGPVQWTIYYTQF